MAGKSNSSVDTVMAIVQLEQVTLNQKKRKNIWNMTHYCGPSNFPQCRASVSAEVIAPLAPKTRFLAYRCFQANRVLIYRHILQSQNICSSLGSDNNIHLRLAMKQLGQLFLQSPDAGVVWRPLVTRITISHLWRRAPTAVCLWAHCPKPCRRLWEMEKSMLLMNQSASLESQACHPHNTLIQLKVENIGQLK